MSINREKIVICVNKEWRNVLFNVLFWGHYYIVQCEEKRERGRSQRERS